MVDLSEIKRGEIYYFSNGSYTGNEQGYDRPGIVVSNDKANRFSGNVTVVWLTTQEKKPMPTHVDIYTTKQKSIAICENVTTISKERIIDYVNTCTEKELKEIDEALCVQLSLNGYVPCKDVNEDVVPVPKEAKVNVEAEINELSIYAAQVEAERDTYKDMYNHLLERLIESR